MKFSVMEKKLTEMIVGSLVRQNWRKKHPKSALNLFGVVVRIRRSGRIDVHVTSSSLHATYCRQDPNYWILIKYLPILEEKIGLIINIGSFQNRRSIQKRFHCYAATTLLS